MGHVSLSDDESVHHEPDHEPGAMNEEEAPEFHCPHYYFARELQRGELPRDGPAQGAFDNRSDFVLGDPGAHFGGEHTCEYPVSGAKGMPHWSHLFRYLFLHFEHVRLLNTVFVLVGTRDLTESSTPHESLSHWPTVEAWWKSRLTMYGPAEELCDLLYIPISQAAGLQHVHPTWAGTFVLAALSFLFPGSTWYCLTVTLYQPVVAPSKEPNESRNPPSAAYAAQEAPNRQPHPIDVIDENGAMRAVSSSPRGHLHGVYSWMGNYSMTKIWRVWASRVGRRSCNVFEKFDQTAQDCISKADWAMMSFWTNKCLSQFSTGLWCQSACCSSANCSG